MRSTCAININKQFEPIIVNVLNACAYDMNAVKSNSARLATLDQLLETVIPAYLTPSPSHETLRAWFDKARIPRFKSNPAAKRGGGPVFYSVNAVEKFLQSRTLPCRLPVLSNKPTDSSHIANN
jgi:hypothetical protein